jgi:3-oxoacyl-[acyl-carrier-protein] synthase-3
MSIRIAELAGYIPAGRISNLPALERFGVDEAFLDQKIGVRYKAQRGEGESVADMCLKAVEALEAKTGSLRGRVKALAVVTQTPDTDIPHVSALVHGRLGLAEDCAVFDISLGCSGYVHALSILGSFMQANGIGEGLLLTCDPYSRCIDAADKNTSLLFGDAAAATLLAGDGKFAVDCFEFGTFSTGCHELEIRDGHVFMNGRTIFNFVCTKVPGCIDRVLERAGLAKDEVDVFVLHQASRFMVEVLAQRLGADPARVPFAIADYGNTVSSSIPLVLESVLQDAACRRVVLCGFGVGLSWAGAILQRDGD